jgi:hypothetical protein
MTVAMVPPGPERGLTPDELPGETTWRGCAPPRSTWSSRSSPSTGCTCNVYQPRLQYGGGVSAFFVGHRGHKYASSVLMAPVTEAFVANIHHFIAARGLDLVSFGKGEDKEAIAHRYLAAFPGDEGVLFVGRAQEKAWVFRTQKRRNPVTGAEYLWLTRATLQVNYFYF